MKHHDLALPRRQRVEHASYIDRNRVIYTGTNGGFLEGFDAGTWSTSLLKYDEGTGYEKFGFMPWEPRTRIKSQPIDDPTSRTMIEAILAQEEEHAAELADLLFAVEPDTDSNTRRLYFADEIPGHSDAGQEVHT